MAASKLPAAFLGPDCRKKFGRLRFGRQAGLSAELLGAALLLLSMALFGYSRFVEWQHAVQTQAVAPPSETLANRLPIPTQLPRTQP